MAAIQAAVNAAVAAGMGSTVVHPAGRYGLAGGNYCTLPRAADRLTAAGRSPFLADGCELCAVRHLTVDFAASNVNQGVVTAINPPGRTVTV